MTTKPPLIGGAAGTATSTVLESVYKDAEGHALSDMPRRLVDNSGMKAR